LQIEGGGPPPNIDRIFPVITDQQIWRLGWDRKNDKSVTCESANCLQKNYSQIVKK